MSSYWFVTQQAKRSPHAWAVHDPGQKWYEWQTGDYCDPRHLSLPHYEPCRYLNSKHQGRPLDKTTSRCMSPAHGWQASHPQPRNFACFDAHLDSIVGSMTCLPQPIRITSKRSVHPCYSVDDTHAAFRKCTNWWGKDNDSRGLIGLSSI